ncbi:MAG: 2-oxoacid:ferredoxin oxidoreductase subunit beta [Candidatus Latescibacteria bacterium]|nr:2-oxoacid:ferredoxin oxidoreductase subunit beta [Candidatus Latescibacterota bacterium]NIM66340.1 2-oxoacid:ferredoxin oxidoreductase subunit beta [Candidatus Latescibacterota bacterium]NIO02819.1 2-oxoacid:ferredoxin oxidoreductase subunit beta [Candidatus Latescibacterota bacterium]NIO29954.1 2-oxoacid:ferredoxin oxidoreductase subunit beta [Candidatus Latescibacterota bacterium]NIO57569.1 2-oxoacid:ferredoxin oxidoreductase subunit beta [Candidatus Latescibacterota bacterium]
MSKITTDETEILAQQHPIAPYLRMDRMPHIWCPTCGIGTVVKCYATALEQSGVDLDKVAVVSGIGCTGRVAGYMKLDAFHTTHGRAIPFATGLKLGRPEMLVTVFSGDGDLAGIGGNHLIHTGRRNIDMLVILVNNFIYGMTGGQNAPTTPIPARSSTMPYGNFEPPFNLPHLVASCGATYVARWTSLHIRRLTKSFNEAIHRKGFRFIEVIAPCSTLYARLNKLGTGFHLMQFYHDHAEIHHGIDTREVGIGYQDTIICGKFIDEEKPTFLELMNNHYRKVLGDKFVPMPLEGGMIREQD